MGLIYSILEIGDLIPGQCLSQMWIYKDIYIYIIIYIYIYIYIYIWDL